MKQYSGKCLCGSVAYVVNGPPVVVAQCHCDACRRTSGTGHTVGAMFPAAGFAISGQTNSYRYRSDQGSEVTKVFCPQCGSPIYGRNTRVPDHVTLSLGTMDTTDGLDVAVVIFARDKLHWDTLGPEVVTFETQPDWTPNE